MHNKQNSSISQFQPSFSAPFVGMLLANGAYKLSNTAKLLIIMIFLVAMAEVASSHAAVLWY